ncbi:chlorophyll a/b-binding protein domain-containing protein [Pelagophyceae sp. CCMP2097]|nr:chlorophyll a/b-binding protein domain-containing protein [Pelagophyceae sp. CCMP2097]
MRSVGLVCLALSGVDAHAPPARTRRIVSRTRLDAATTSLDGATRDLQSEPTNVDFESRNNILRGPGKATPAAPEPPRTRRVQQTQQEPQKKSAALPWADAPTWMDGRTAGDRGFDPLRLANAQSFDFLREAEIKHGRFACIGAVSWVACELVTHVRTEAPPAPVLFALGAAAAAVELRALLLSVRSETAAGARRTADSGIAAHAREAGDFGFDPLRMLPVEKQGRLRMREAELKHGRVAMVAVVAFSAFEALTGAPVV